MLTADEPDQADAMEDIAERMVDALEKLADAKPPAAPVVQPPAVQVAAPVVRVTMPAALPHGWTFNITARDAEGRIKTFTATPSLAK